MLRLYRNVESVYKVWLGAFPTASSPKSHAHRAAMISVISAAGNSKEKELAMIISNCDLDYVCAHEIQTCLGEFFSLLSA